MALSYNDISSRIPELSYVPPQNFYAVIELLPAVVFNIQQLQIPTLNGGEVPLPNRMNPSRTFIPGNGLDYSSLDITFLIDKQFANYRSVLEWLKGINHPENFDQYNNWVNKSTSSTQSGFSSTTSNITVFGCDAGNNPLIHWNFKDCFPISLDGPRYDAALADINYITSVVSFRYTYFECQTYTDGRLNNDKI
jgi:hypothetical protein